MILKHWKLGKKGQQRLTDGNERRDPQTGPAHCLAHWPGSRLHYVEQEVQRAKLRRWSWGSRKGKAARAQGMED